MSTSPLAGSCFFHLHSRWLSLIYNKKCRMTSWSSGVPVFTASVRLRSRYGARIGAGTAVNAGFGVDHIFAVTLGDSTHGATLGASAAGDAIVGNFVSHVQGTSFFHLLYQCSTFPCKNQLYFLSIRSNTENTPCVFSRMMYIM